MEARFISLRVRGIIFLALGVLLVHGLGEVTFVAVLALVLLVSGIAELSSGVQGVAPGWSG